MQGAQYGSNTRFFNTVSKKKPPLKQWLMHSL